MNCHFIFFPNCTLQHYLEAEGSPGEYPTNLCEHIVNEVARALVTSCFCGDFSITYVTKSFVDKECPTIIIGVIQEQEIRLALYVAKATRNTSLLPYPTC